MISHWITSISAVLLVSLKASSFKVALGFADVFIGIDVKVDRLSKSIYFFNKLEIMLFIQISNYQLIKAKQYDIEGHILF